MTGPFSTTLPRCATKSGNLTIPRPSACHPHDRLKLSGNHTVEQVIPSKMPTPSRCFGVLGIWIASKEKGLTYQTGCEKILDKEKLTIQLPITRPRKNTTKKMRS
jgi:hypothetical protein